MTIGQVPCWERWQHCAKHVLHWTLRCQYVEHHMVI